MANGLRMSNTTARQWIPLLLSSLVLLSVAVVVEAGSSYSSWSKKYNYGQNLDGNNNYRNQYNSMYSNANQVSSNSGYSYQNNYEAQTYNEDYDDGDDDGDDDGNDDGASEAHTNSYQDDPGFSYFLEGTAGCSGSGYNLEVNELVVTCGGGDYHGFDSSYNGDGDEDGYYGASQLYYYNGGDDEDADEQEDESNSNQWKYPKRHYCQFDEEVTVSGVSKFAYSDVCSGWLAIASL